MKFFLFLIFIFLSPICNALQIDRTSLAYSHNSNIETINIRNNSSEAKSYQASVYVWQDTNRRHQVKTFDLFPSPTVFTISAHGSQSIRVGLFTKNHSQDVKGYRLEIQQLPQNELMSKNINTGMQVLYSVNIPVVVFPKQPLNTQWHWNYLKNSHQLVFTNTGNSIISFKKCLFTDDHGVTHKPKQRVAYVFPGQTLHISTPADKKITSISQSIYDFKRQTSKTITLPQ
ncbi:fimbrial biogenesis chaperone [Vibrio marisflavi]|uniref:Pili assembly chaperone N-terminal domain-containing protein n=1 Tax=Vibrio marisflavi CECT 7928 TaxID=634439 RepID=A0ABN8E3K7_9VIBR|nr:fimbria/pilus periplasmic chaperone [Vibrio marisflavi]CAH0537225.1 hypothetical protein VMF7928_01002 [Vibrio marisflavi CECT 7928]